MFRNIYEIFGINPFFSQNMASFLAGIEDLCEEPYSGMSLYNWYGMIAVIIAVVIFLLQYKIIDKAKFSGPKWWWTFASMVFSFNFGYASISLWTLLKNAVLNFECNEEFINVIFKFPEVATFAFVSAALGFIIFTLLSWPPFIRKNISTSCRTTTPFSH